MLKNLFKFTLILTPFIGTGQSKYDMGAASIVENYRTAATMSGDSHDTGSVRVSLMVTVESDAVVGQLRDFGAEVRSVRNGVALVSVAVKDIEAISQLPGVISIERGREQRPMMYFARSSANADAVLDGTGSRLTQAYTGNGVVTGLMDQGIDPNHVAFQNEELSANRVKAVYTYLSTTKVGAPSASYTTPEAIAGFKCDNSGWTHGTHVASIMAGGYNGTGNFGLNGRVENSKPMPYYGLARNSEIVMCGGYLADDNIIDGVEKVIDYAKSVGKPAVVNLSIGSVTGPHDGTSSFSRYLAGLGEDAIIVVAAGNDGTSDCALNTTFNRFSPSVTTGINITEPEERAFAEFWYNTSDAFKFEFLLYDMSNRTASSYAIDQTGRNYTVNTSDKKFASAFASGSYVKMYANVDPVNNRYYVRMEMVLGRGTSSDMLLVPAVRITGATGKRLNANISNGNFAANGISGAVSGTPNGSISDMATGDNIIVAGAYTSAKSFTTMSGAQLVFQDATANGQLCLFSSYGTTYQGDALPDLCAPGSAIVAAVNSYAYVSPNSNSYSAVTMFNNRKNYWAVMQGTSMACPFISGTVALMLEADPALDVDKARAILKETAIAPPATATSDEKLQWGAGRIDVLAAVKRVLDEKAGVGSIIADDERNFILTATDGGYNVYVAGESALTVTLYDAAGCTVASVSAQGNTVDIDTSALRPGIYIISAQGNTQLHNAKIAVK